MPQFEALKSPPSLDLVDPLVEPFDRIEDADLSPLLDRIGDSRIALIGEASHGTSEFYRMRERITRALIERKGFTVVAAEADWPDAERVDEYVRGRSPKPKHAWQAFSRFPSWMWRNEETLAFIEWLKRRNDAVADPSRRAGFYGLDLYSMETSMREVIAYLESRDVELAELARLRYGSLLSFDEDYADYGRRALSDRYASSEDEVVAMLADLLTKRLTLLDGVEESERFFDASRNAAVVKAAEEYYRLLFQGSYVSWNHRDRHMFSTLEAILANRGDAKAVVWAHNSHVGDAGQTEMAQAGETNIGEIAREAYPGDCYIIGFGTHTGEVAAADNWGGEVQIKQVRPSRPDSYERLFHDWATSNFLLPLRGNEGLRERLGGQKLERAIGVIYRPQTELVSHYFRADLPSQFDEYIWFDETTAVKPLLAHERAPEFPERHPFLLAD